MLAGGVAAVGVFKRVSTPRPLLPDAILHMPASQYISLPPSPPPQLDAKLRDALAGRTSLFAEGGAGAGLAASLQRPLLCLFDRNFELSVVLQHAWTYKPLVGWPGWQGGWRAGCGGSARACHLGLVWPVCSCRMSTRWACALPHIVYHHEAQSVASPVRPHCAGARRAGHAAEPHHAA